MLSSPSPSIAVAALVGAVGVAAYAAPSHSNLILTIGGAVVSSVALLLFSKATSPSLVSTALSPNEWRDFPLISKEQISPNTAIYRLKLQSPTIRLGLPIGQHISIQGNIDGKLIQRSYTPISSDDDLGIVDLLIKSYPLGNISKLFASLNLGDNVKVKGPKGQFKYVPNMVRELGMIAGGTGLTPMLQVIKAILKNPLDKTKIKFIFANVSFQDILLKDQLDDLASKHSDRFSIYYVLNNPPENWTGGVGFVTKDMIAKHLPSPAKDVKILLCGPPPMIKALVQATESLGFDKTQSISKAGDQVFKF